MNLPRPTTKDILAILVVGASLVFNGISLIQGRPLDAATMGLAGIVIGHYFKGSEAPKPEPLAEPFTGDEPA